MRTKISLNGLWDYQLPNGPWEKREVPGSYQCVGKSVYQTNISFPTLEQGQKLAVCFEGIAYEGKLYLNGTYLGTMLPYSYYRFDITGMDAGENVLRLELDDLTAIFGPAEGWKNYSGIIREVYLETYHEKCLEDVFFTYTLSENYTKAQCNVAVQKSCTDGTVSAKLLWNGKVVAQTDGESMSLEDIRLWSPESPSLYDLEVSLNADGAVTDTYRCRVGFKELSIQDEKFFLNGQPIFITGVCRHDLWTDDEGFTQTDDMIRRDLLMIKHLGVNYVRLVHYPHDRRVVDIADELGLMVSEEPGLWWSDLSNKEITGRALQVLENVIYRDRNHVSVAFWLSFNECVFTDEFLADSVKVARRCDPSRLISGANCMSIIDTKEMFDRHGVDFYTFHPYGVHPDSVAGGYGYHNVNLETVCRTLSGKPLIFTEWGGYHVEGNPYLFTNFCKLMYQYYQNSAPEPTLAGMSYWAWQDIYEAERGEPACTDGVLYEGLVTVDRQLKVNYRTFSEFLSWMKQPKPEIKPEVVVAGVGAADKTYVPVALPAPDADSWTAAVAASEPMGGTFFYKTKRRITYGPALPKALSKVGAVRADMPAGKPNVIGKGQQVQIDVNAQAEAVWFIGQATMGKGYPISGEYAQQIGTYTLTYTDGTTQVIPLRNGLECATVFGLFGPTQFEPQAAYATRAFSVSYDKNWEVYRTGAMRCVLDAGRQLKSITAEVTAEDYFLLLYGISLEK